MDRIDSRLESLPVELRLKIYNYALTGYGDGIIMIGSYSDGQLDEEFLHTFRGLLLTCRRLSYELRYYFFKDYTLVFMSDTGDSGRELLKFYRKLHPSGREAMFKVHIPFIFQDLYDASGEAQNMNIPSNLPIFQSFHPSFNLEAAIFAINRLHALTHIVIGLDVYESIFQHGIRAKDIHLLSDTFWVAAWKSMANARCHITEALKEIGKIRRIDQIDVEINFYGLFLDNRPIVSAAGLLLCNSERVVEIEEAVLTDLRKWWRAKSVRVHTPTGYREGFQTSRSSAYYL